MSMPYFWRKAIDYVLGEVGEVSYFTIIILQFILQLNCFRSIKPASVSLRTPPMKLFKVNNWSEQKPSGNLTNQDT